MHLYQCSFFSLFQMSLQSVQNCGAQQSSLHKPCYCFCTTKIADKMLVLELPSKIQGCNYLGQPIYLFDSPVFWLLSKINTVSQLALLKSLDSNCEILLILRNVWWLFFSYGIQFQSRGQMTFPVPKPVCKFIEWFCGDDWHTCSCLVFDLSCVRNTEVFFCFCT